jgi:hypothetical protein
MPSFNVATFSTNFLIKIFQNVVMSLLVELSFRLMKQRCRLKNRFAALVAGYL